MSQATCSPLHTHSPHTHTHTFPSPHDAQAQRRGYFDCQRHSIGAACVQFVVELVGAYAAAVQVTLSGCVAADATDWAAVATALAAIICALRRPRAAS